MQNYTHFREVQLEPYRQGQFTPNSASRTTGAQKWPGAAVGAYPAKENLPVALREGWNPRGAMRLQPLRLPVHRNDRGLTNR
jgi:hypothetical protein